MKYGVKTRMKYGLIWLATGILFTYMWTAIACSEKGSLSCFYNNGAVLEISKSEFAHSNSSCDYIEDQGYLVFAKQSSGFKFKVKRPSTLWQYIQIDVAKASQQNTSCRLIFYNKEDEEFGEQWVDLTEGQNLFQLEAELLDAAVLAEESSADTAGTQDEDEIAYVKLQWIDQQGEKIAIESFRFMEFNPIIERTTVVITALLTFLVYIACSAAVVIIRGICYIYSGSGRQTNRLGARGNLAAVDVLQYIYRAAFEPLGCKIGKKLSMREKEMLCRSLFFLLFLFIYLNDYAGWSEAESAYKYYMLVIAFLFYLLGAVLWSKPLREVSWKHTPVSGWLLFWSMTCVSELFQEKKDYAFVGYVMLFAVGYFFFSWGNLKRGAFVVRSMLFSFEVFYLVQTVLCMIFRGKRLGVFYNGVYNTSEKAAVCSMAAFVVFLVETDMELCGQKRLKKMILWAAGLGISLYSIHISGNAVCMGTALLLGTAFFMKYIWHNRQGLLGIIRRESMYLLVLGIVMLISAGLFRTAVKNLPYRLHTDTIFETDILVTGLSAEDQAALSAVRPGALDGAVSPEKIKATSVWWDYMKKLSLFGAKTGTQQRMPSNAYIEAAYRYGIFTVIPLCLYLAGCIGGGAAGILRNRKRDQTAFFIFSAAAAASILFMLTNSFEPFSNPLWIFVFCMGQASCLENNEKALPDAEETAIINS